MLPFSHEIWEHLYFCFCVYKNKKLVMMCVAINKE